MELVDTDVLIDVQRGFRAAEEWFATDRDIAVPGFVVMELVQDARNSDEVRKALALVDSLDVVWPSPAECQSALDQFAQLHLPHGLGLLDSLIAATAVGHGSVLNTFNDRHYRMFPGLMTVRPYRR
jgi:predicted nucleic acid-binding protein